VDLRKTNQVLELFFVVVFPLMVLSMVFEDSSSFCFKFVWKRLRIWNEFNNFMHVEIVPHFDFEIIQKTTCENEIVIESCVKGIQSMTVRKIELDVFQSPKHVLDFDFFELPIGIQLKFESSILS